MATTATALPPPPPLATMAAMMDRQVSGWGVYCYDFLRLPTRDWSLDALTLSTPVLSLLPNHRLSNRRRV